ncbi:MAG: methyltransferase domain-containing protein [Cyanobacteria bacterium P01_A01_bin.68]
MNKSHLAAPHRKHFSATAKIMLNRQLLTKTETHLDYGCGRGSDVERLRSLGYSSTGYDPYYFPGVTKPADVVTMSYVLNVIANPQERREALLNAWKLTRKRLIVSSKVCGSGINSGNFTSIGTFTKSYNFIELKAYIESTLGYEAIKLAKDKFLVCRKISTQFTPLHYDEVIKKSRLIAASGWVAPKDCIIRSYFTNNKKTKYFRVEAKSKILSGKNGRLVKCLHIRNGSNSEHMQWVLSGLHRRNQILQMKFHCT